MKIVLVGGHLSPALAVIEALPKDTKILFVGRKHALEGDKALSLEFKTVNQLNIPFVSLNTGRWQRKFTRYTIPSFFKLPSAIFRSFLALIRFKPDVVVGFGGYVSLPVVLCAYCLRIPIVIHEQTLEAGFANRFLARLATKICISWQTSRHYFPKEKVVLTGNPIRQFTINNSQLTKDKNKLPTIYITGGSSGSHFINTLIGEIIKELLERYIVIHQTGDAQEFHDFDRLAKIRQSLPLKLRERYEILKFVDPSEVGEILNRVSLVVSRSGMNIVTELIYFGKPALLIPLPFSQNNEQLKNAKFLEKMGLGKVLQQDDIDSKSLFQAIDLAFHNIGNYKINKNEFKSTPYKNAAQNIISVINYVAKGKKKFF
mgnify:CR=1 FL=1